LIASRRGVAGVRVPAVLSLGADARERFSAAGDASGERP
jgi:hypothetical protein